MQVTHNTLTDQEIIHDREEMQFRLALEEGFAVVNYVERDGKMRLIHSEVPFEMRGKGIGKELVEKTFDHILEHGEKAVAVCSYIKAVARSSDKWKDSIE